MKKVASPKWEEDQEEPIAAAPRENKNERNQ
jgi:hypothetical protein